MYPCFDYLLRYPQLFGIYKDICFLSLYRCIINYLFIGFSLKNVFSLSFLEIFFFFHPSSVILETTLWVGGFPIVSKIGSCCLGVVGLCQLLPSMLINRICWDHRCCVSPDASSCFHCIYLCISWKVFLLLCQGLHSASTSVAGSGHPHSYLHEKMVSEVGDVEFDPGWDLTLELQNCILASIHWATTSPKIKFISAITWLLSRS